MFFETIFQIGNKMNFRVFVGKIYKVTPLQLGQIEYGF